MALNNQKGFTLIELVIAVAVVGILASVAIPAFKVYKRRAYDSTTQASLKSVFTACKDYWTVNSSMSPCLLTTLSSPEYGFTPSKDVEISIDSNANNTEYEFQATASHTSSPNVYKIDFSGIVSKLHLDDEDENNDNNGDEDGNNGNGCSEEAHANPDDLGQNAKGGCNSYVG